MKPKRPCGQCPVGGTFNPSDQTCSIPDPTDGLPLTCVGAWAMDKHARVQRYVNISKHVREKFVNGPGTAYIELFCGPGKSRIMGTTNVIDGSALCAAKAAMESGFPYSYVHIGDQNLHFLDTAAKRLETLGVTAFKYTGPAEATVRDICKAIDRRGLYFAFLDPYNLKALPFSVIEHLADIQRMDILMHVSINDLQRNLSTYVSAPDSVLDTFVPSWRTSVDTRNRPKQIRDQILGCWLNRIEKLDMRPSGVEDIELVTGKKNQPLYWLVFAARHERAIEFWNKIRDIDRQRSLNL